MARKKDLPCADCGELLWRGTGSLAAGKARCRPCRNKNPQSQRRGKKCLDCGLPSTGIRCKPCAGNAQIVRALDDIGLERHRREQAAPGLTPAARKRLSLKWRQQRRTCAYCPNLATTIDHIIPLVRGGTNYEGNLAPACKRCNSSKAGKFISEWRHHRQPSRALTAPRWARTIKTKQFKPKPLPVLHPCPICSQWSKWTACSPDCGREWWGRLERDKYRLEHGLPVDHARPVRRRSSSFDSFDPVAA